MIGAVAAVVGAGHAGPDQGRQAERTFQVDVHHLVVERLADGIDARVQRRHAGVVDQDVTATEFGVHRVVEPVAVGRSPA